MRFHFNWCPFVFLEERQDGFYRLQFCPKFVTIDCCLTKAHAIWKSLTGFVLRISKESKENNQLCISSVAIRLRGNFTNALIYSSSFNESLANFFWRNGGLTNRLPKEQPAFDKAHESFKKNLYSRWQRKPIKFV